MRRSRSGSLVSDSAAETAGDVRQVDIKDARKAARAWFAKVALSKDPSASRGRREATAAKVARDLTPR